MATYTKEFLSASTNGRSIKVVATATAGTTIHTAVSGTTSKDEVWLWASNTDTAYRTLTIELGGTTSPDDLIIIELAPKAGRVPILLGECLNNGLLIKAFASAANVVTIGGFVNRIST